MNCNKFQNEISNKCNTNLLLDKACQKHILQCKKCADFYNITNEIKKEFIAQKQVENQLQTEKLHASIMQQLINQPNITQKQPHNKILLYKILLPIAAILLFTLIIPTMHNKNIPDIKNNQPPIPAPLTVKIPNMFVENKLKIDNILSNNSLEQETEYLKDDIKKAGRLLLCLVPTKIADNNPN